MANIKIKEANLAVLKRLAENNAGPKPYNPGRPGRLLKREEVKEIDKPMTFKVKKMKPIY